MTPSHTATVKPSATTRPTLARLLAGIAVACSAGLLGIAPAHAQSTNWVSVDRAEINMRSGPGTGHPVIWQISRGFPMQVLDNQGGWIKVRDFEADEGWVSRNLTAKKRHHVVKAKVANIRRGPGTNTRIVGKAHYGEVLPTLAKRGDWVQVKTPAGKRGWIADRLLWGW